MRSMSDGGAWLILIDGGASASIDFQRFGWGGGVTDIQKLVATMALQKKKWFFAACGGIGALPECFDAWVWVADRARTVLGHWT